MAVVLAILFTFAFVLLISIIFIGLGWSVLNAIISFKAISYDQLIEWYTQSVRLGARWFLQLLFIVPDLMIGVLGCYVFEWLFHVHLGFSFILLLGLTAGIAGGFLSGSLAFHLLRKVFKR